MKRKNETKVPKDNQWMYEMIVDLTDEFCKKHLDQEYAELARKLTAALARKRPTPLVSGSFESWACAIIYVLGKVNFLFDKSQTPHIRAEDLCSKFGVSTSNGSAKAKKIIDMFRICQMEPRWSRKSLIVHSPLAWLIELNGILVDARRLPREIQEEAFELGLIPYLPDL